MLRGKGKGPIFSGVQEAVSLTMGLGSGHRMILPPNPFLPSHLLEEASPVLPLSLVRSADALALQLGQALSSAWGSSGSGCSVI